MYGPVHTIEVSPGNAKFALPSADAFDTTAPAPVDKAPRISEFGSLSLIVTVEASVASTDATAAKSPTNCETSFVRALSIEYTTSSTVKALPSQKVTPSRSFTTSVVASV